MQFNALIPIIILLHTRFLRTSNASMLSPLFLKILRILPSLRDSHIIILDSSHIDQQLIDLCHANLRPSKRHQGNHLLDNIALIVDQYRRAVPVRISLNRHIPSNLAELDLPVFNGSLPP